MISEFVEYVKQVWKNKPNVSSPLNADRLNHMESGIENNSKKIKETVTAVNELTENSTINLKDKVNMDYVKSMEYATAIVSGKTVQIVAVLTLKEISANTTTRLITGIPIPKESWIQDIAGLSNEKAVSIALGENLAIWYNKSTISENTIIVINSTYIKA